jgi:hypothetical protein
VEFAIATRLVGKDDLYLLDAYRCDEGNEE